MTTSTDRSNDPKGLFKRGGSRSDEVDQKRVQERQMRNKLNMTKTRVAREMSCVPADQRTRRGDDGLIGPTPEQEREEGEKLAAHLKAIAPFHERWEIIETVNAGTYGVVFSVRDVKTKTMGVIKVAKAGSNDSIVNTAASWEAFVLEKVFKANPEASICRLLDHGMLQSFQGIGLEFVVLENVGLKIHTHLSEFEGKARQLRACQLSIMMLKGIYDLHKEGLLHRDLKPDNMGLLSREQPIVIIYDLGMARMYTDGDGKTRAVRSSAPFRGTVEWASGRALQCREQTRFDDLVAWLYCVIEIFQGNPDGPQSYPWSGRGRYSKEAKLFKSSYAPARFLLRHLPQSYYAINAYLMTAPRTSTPDYGFIADRIKDAMEEVMPGSTADMGAMTQALGPAGSTKSAVGTSSHNIKTPK